MKIGVIGVGNIAQKAYLPVYAENREQAEFIIATRNEAVRTAISQKYGFAQTVATVDELIAQKIEACFVHAATKAHAALVAQLLQAGIHVFVDKPLSENLEEVRALQQLAKEKQLLLMVGFNRRFAPLVDSLKAIPEKQSIRIQKNRIAAQQPTDFVIYDLFLHVIDTAVYLLDQPLGQVYTNIVEEKGQLKRALLHLETATTSVLCTMDLVSGANTESFEVTSPQGTYLLENLTQLTIKTAEQTTIKEMGDWTTTLEKRGFQQMVTQFLAALTAPEAVNLRQEHVYTSHELCKKMLLEKQRHVL
jgi:virulence factor